MDYRTQPSVETYLKDFCESLEPSEETYVESFLQLLENEDNDSWTLTNMDSGVIQAVEPPVWPNDLMDLQDLLEDMSPDDWAQVMEDVLEPLDLDAFDLDTFVSLSPEDIVDLSIEDGAHLMEDVMEPLDLDAFVS